MIAKTLAVLRTAVSFALIGAVAIGAIGFSQSVAMVAAVLGAGAGAWASLTKHHA